MRGRAGGGRLVEEEGSRIGWFREEREKGGDEWKRRGRE